MRKLAVRSTLRILYTGVKVPLALLQITQSVRKLLEDTHGPRRTR